MKEEHPDPPGFITLKSVDTLGNIALVTEFALALLIATVGIITHQVIPEPFLGSLPTWVQELPELVWKFALAAGFSLLSLVRGYSIREYTDSRKRKYLKTVNRSTAAILFATGLLFLNVPNLAKTAEASDTDAVRIMSWALIALFPAVRTVIVHLSGILVDTILDGRTPRLSSRRR